MPLNRMIQRRRTKRTLRMSTNAGTAEEQQQHQEMIQDLSLSDNKKNLTLDHPTALKSKTTNAAGGAKNRGRTKVEPEHGEDELSSGDAIIQNSQDNDKANDRPAPVTNQDSDESSFHLDHEHSHVQEDVRQENETKKSKGRRTKKKAKRKTAVSGSNATRSEPKSTIEDKENAAASGRRSRRHVAASNQSSNDDDKSSDEAFATESDGTADSGEEVPPKTIATTRRSERKMMPQRTKADTDADISDDGAIVKSSRRTTKSKAKDASHRKERTRQTGKSSDNNFEDNKPKQAIMSQKSMKPSPKHDDSDEIAPTKNTGHKANSFVARRSPRRRVTRLNLKEDPSSDVDDDFDIKREDVSLPSSETEPRRSARKRITSKDVDNSEGPKKKLHDSHPQIKSSKGGTNKLEKSIENGSSLKGRPSRQAASRAANKVAAYLDDKSYLKYESTSKDDDEEFELEGDSNTSEAESVDDDDESFMRGRVDAGNVDVDASFLDADESGDEESSEKPPRKNSLLMLAQSRDQHVKYGGKKREADDTEDILETITKPSRQTSLFSPHMPYCQSKVDAITMEPLPKKHICFYMPDQKTKQCFALETLHKIALTGTVIYADEKVTFKQPPHFRTPMSADMIDQIASRFGRAAVDVKGHFYNPGKLEFDYTVNFDDLEDDEQFNERVNRYVTNCMGSRDIYCCPICYTEAHRRLEIDENEGILDDDSSDEETDDLNLEFIADPMTIVGFVDNNEFKLASAFCFGKLVQLKQHLRKDHSVDPSAVQGNDLYKRFQIRAADGLLQRFLDKTKNKSKAKHRISRQGEMVSYWLAGNNEIFVFLLDLMDRWTIARPKIEQNSDAEETDEHLDEFHDLGEKIATFWSSFAIRGRRIWEVVSEPYQKATKEELEDFLDDGDVADGEAIQYHLINREIEAQQSDEEGIVAALSHRCTQDIEDGSSSDDTKGDELISSSDEVDMKYYSEESEEDEWEQQVTRKRKARVKKDRRRSNVKIVEIKGAKKLGGLKKPMNEPTPPTSIIQSSSAERSSAKKKRRVIVDSDSD